jgi:hypothetical protein
MTDLRTLTRGTQLVAFAAVLLLASDALAEKTAWLVRPLYPGQEALVERTEKALDKLMPGDARKDAVIGKAELAAALKGKVVAQVPCFDVDARCADPIDPFVAGLGFDRIVLVQGGQDEAGFKFRVVSYEPATKKVNPSSATNANLEKALLGAIARVVPVASTLEVKSNPVGATVYVDDAKVGVTPLTTQVLPGERVVRLDLKLHQPIEETLVIPIRGAASLDKTLEKVAARILITASPAGTEISIDGQVAGKDRVDRGIAPGDHTIRLTASEHRAFEQTITVKPDQQFTLDKSLEPLNPPKAPVQTVLITPVTPVEGTNPALTVKPATPVTPAPAPPPRVLSPAEQIYERKSYFHVSYEMGFLTRDTLVGRRFGERGFGRTTKIQSPSGAPPNLTLVGASAEYGVFGKYFGVTVFGLSYLTNMNAWTMEVGHEPGQAPESSAGVTGPANITNVRAHLGIIRALHPQVRFAVWRFMFAFQAGLEFRGGQILGTDPDGVSVFYKDGFVPLELLVAGRLNVRFFIADGFFMHLQGNYTQYLLGERAVDMTGGGNFGSASSFGFNVGFGYGF